MPLLKNYAQLKKKKKKKEKKKEQNVRWRVVQSFDYNYSSPLYFLSKLGR